MSIGLHSGVDLSWLREGRKKEKKDKFWRCLVNKAWHSKFIKVKLFKASLEVDNLELQLQIFSVKDRWISNIYFLLEPFADCLRFAGWEVSGLEVWPILVLAFLSGGKKLKSDYSKAQIHEVCYCRIITMPYGQSRFYELTITWSWLE